MVALLPSRPLFRAAAAATAAVAGGSVAARSEEAAERRRVWGKSVRRIVTGHDGHGKAVVLEDRPAPNAFEPPGRDGVQVNNLWRTHRPRPTIPAAEDEPCPAGAAVPLLPPRGGTTFRIIEFSPEASWIDKIGRSSGNWLPLTDVGSAARHPLMHRSETLDYALCLEGRIYCVLDEGEVLMEPGDVLVQRGTNHAWKNSFDQPCRMAFVLIDGEFEPGLRSTLGESKEH